MNKSIEHVSRSFEPYDGGDGRCDRRCQALTHSSLTRSLPPPRLGWLADRAWSPKTAPRSAIQPTKPSITDLVTGTSVLRDEDRSRRCSFEGAAFGTISFRLGRRCRWAPFLSSSSSSTSSSEVVVVVFAPIRRLKLCGAEWLGRFSPRLRGPAWLGGKRAASSPAARLSKLFSSFEVFCCCCCWWWCCCCCGLWRVHAKHLKNTDFTFGRWVPRIRHPHSWHLAKPIVQPGWRWLTKPTRFACLVQASLVYLSKWSSGRSGCGGNLLEAGRQAGMWRERVTDWLTVPRLVKKGIPRLWGS